MPKWSPLKAAATHYWAMKKGYSQRFPNLYLSINKLASIERPLIDQGKNPRQPIFSFLLGPESVSELKMLERRVREFPFPKQ